MAEKQIKRRQLLVDGDLQLGMSLRLVGWLYAYAIGFAVLANASSIGAVLVGSEGDAGYAAAVDRLEWFAQSTVLPLALTFVCVAAHCLVFTHRVAGPVHRIRTVLGEIAARKLPVGPVTLRDRDYFKDVAAEVNKVVDAQREDAARQRRMNAEIASAVRDISAALDEERASMDELRALAKQALDRTERVDRHLAAVELPPAPPPAAPGAVVTDVAPLGAEPAGA
jgi:methyl-accepting chemotaxis protein